jgi:Methyltransferase domain
MPHLASRATALRAGLELARLTGLEIGPLANPIVHKSDGAITYIDHTDTASLRETYRNDPNIDIDRIVEVDAVWGEQTLAACVGHATFDYVLASHVAEHVPDLITWLQEVRAVLRAGGQLRLALPDCRFSFDALRDETRLVDLLTNRLLRARRPQLHNVLDFRLNYAPAVDGAGIYEGRSDLSRVQPTHSFQCAIESAEAARDMPERYFDVHCWVFQPRTFARLMAELAEHGLLPLACAGVIDTAPPLLEFYVFLTPCDDPARATASWRNAIPALRDPLPGSLAAPAASAAADRPQLAALTAELAAARQALAEAEARVAGLEASTSWRLTAPLRWLMERRLALPCPALQKRKAPMASKISTLAATARP